MPGHHKRRSQPTKWTIAGPSAQPYEYPTGISLLFTLLALAFGTFLMALDTTIITVAIPGITTQFNALDQVGWIGSALSHNIDCISAHRR